MPEISELNRINQRTVRRLSREKSVRVDRITGLLDTLKDQFYEANPNATGIDWSFGTTTVNGEVPPGIPKPIQDSRDIVDEIIGDERILVSIGRREAGTRAGIHVHEYGGATFVIGGKGKVTDFVEGLPDGKYPVGNYYYMPIDLPMTATNLSKKDVILMDIFVTPIGEPFITFIEPGYPPA